MVHHQTAVLVKGQAVKKEYASEEDEGEMKLQDETHVQTNTLVLRRTIYLTIMSNLSFEECAHKVLQMSIKPGQEYTSMIIECCSQERSYRKFFGLLGQKLCQLNPEYVDLWSSM